MKLFIISLILIVSTTVAHGQMMYGTDAYGKSVLIRHPLQWEGFNPATSKGKIADMFLAERVQCESRIYIFHSPVVEDLQHNVSFFNVKQIECYIIRGGEVIPTHADLWCSSPTSEALRALFNSSQHALRFVSGKNAHYYFNEPIVLPGVQLIEGPLKLPRYVGTIN